MLRDVLKVAIGDLGELIGHHHFLGQAEKEQQQPAQHVVGRRALPMVEIAEEFARAHDGPGHQLREERNEQRVIDGIGDRFLFLAVDIDHVRHALERVKADSQRKNDAEREGVLRPVQQVRDVGGEEIVVLEEAEQAEIGGQADRRARLCASVAS